jgi:hypothetical protein
MGTLIVLFNLFLIASAINWAKSAIKLPSYNNPACTKLWQQLLIHVKNPATAEKAVQDLREKYPDKSDEWYIQKAILITAKQ